MPNAEWTLSWPEPLRRKLDALPDQPGCYLMRDRNGRIIYVGKAASLRQRVRSYFQPATLRTASPKLRSLIKSIADLDVFPVRNEAEAVLTEGRLIKEYRPRYNVAFRDDKRFLLIRVNRADPFPRLKLVRLRREDGAEYFGPYASAAAARATVEFVEKRFGLRKCPPELPDAETYRHCINDIVRFCSAPCIGRVTRDAYLDRVDEAGAFLRGERPELLKELRARMTEAAASLNFETAATLRDTLHMLDQTVRQRARATLSPERRREVARRGLAELAERLGLPRPPEVIEAFDISTISGSHSVASMVCAVGGMPHRARYRRFRIRGVEGVDDPRMIAEVVRRRYARLRDEGGAMPDLVLVDGGITQLRAARAELASLGLSAVPVAGLAKQYEEIHYRDPGEPLRLSRDAEALKVLQRIRDEAHRFAITYNRLLRSRRLRESALDDIEGVGPARKAALLRHFGSVTRLANATEADVATAVPGIGPELARGIVAALHRNPRDTRRVSG